MVWYMYYYIIGWHQELIGAEMSNTQCFCWCSIHCGKRSKGGHLVYEGVGPTSLQTNIMQKEFPLDQCITWQTLKAYNFIYGTDIRISDQQTHKIVSWSQCTCKINDTLLPPNKLNLIVIIVLEKPGSFCEAWNYSAPKKWRDSLKILLKPFTGVCRMMLQQNIIMILLLYTP